MRVSDPLGLRVPPLIVRAMTRGRTLRSAKLLWAGTPGTATKIKSSGKNCSTHSQGVLGSKSVGVRLAKLPEMLLEGVLLCHAKAVELAWRQSGIEWLLDPGNRLLIDRFHILGPGQQNLILGIELLEIMDIT